MKFWIDDDVFGCFLDRTISHCVSSVGILLAQNQKFKIVLLIHTSSILELTILWSYRLDFCRQDLGGDFLVNNRFLFGSESACVRSTCFAPGWRKTSQCCCASCLCIGAIRFSQTVLSIATSTTSPQWWNLRVEKSTRWSSESGRKCSEHLDIFSTETFVLQSPVFYVIFPRVDQFQINRSEMSCFFFAAFLADFLFYAHWALKCQAPMLFRVSSQNDNALLLHFQLNVFLPKSQILWLILPLKRRICTLFELFHRNFIGM